MLLVRFVKDGEESSSGGHSNQDSIGIYFRSAQLTLDQHAIMGLESDISDRFNDLTRDIAERQLKGSNWKIDYITTMIVESTKLQGMTKFNV